MSRARITTPSGAARSSDTRNRISNAYACLRWDIMSEVPLGPQTSTARSRPGLTSQPVSQRSGKPTTWSECRWVRNTPSTSCQRTLAWVRLQRAAAGVDQDLLPAGLDEDARATPVHGGHRGRSGERRVGKEG